MKMKQTKSKSNLLVKVGVMLMVVMVLLSAFAPMKASAHSAYLLTLTLNTADSRYEPNILFDRAGWGQNHAAHRESKIGYFGGYDYASTALPSMKNGNPETVEEALKGLENDKYVKGGIGNPHFIYSFPGYHGTKDYDAGAEDLARAEWISKTMVQSLNDAIGFVTQVTGKKPDRYELMFLGTNLANGGYTSGSFKYGGADITVKGGVDAPNAKSKVSGVNKDGYAKVTVKKDGETTERYFVSKVPKGYKENQPLYPSMPKELQDLTLTKDVHGFSEDVRSMTWKHVVLQAHYSYQKNEVTYDNFEVISKPNKVETYLTDLGENFLLMLRTMLGLYSFNELMLNEGSRGGDGFFLGIMPTSWLNSASILHWTSMALSWLLIMFAFARLLALRNLAAINVAQRVDMVEGIKNLIVVGFALMLFNPIFYTLANFNWLLVDIMKNTSNVTSSFGTSAPGGGLLAKLLISFAYLVIEIYFNFIYIARGIIVAILYGVGPLFVASLAFGGKYAQIFSSYIKELIGSIYMQTFHAILVAFFATVTIFGGVRLFEQLVVLFAFIPLTKFFREALGVGGGLADIAGAGAFGAVGDMAKMGTKSMRQNGGKWTSNAKKAQSVSKSSSGAPATQMKSSSNFQANGAGGSASSMADNDWSSIGAGGAIIPGKATANVGGTGAGMGNGTGTGVGGNAGANGMTGVANGANQTTQSGYKSGAASGKGNENMSDLDTSWKGLTKGGAKSALGASAGLGGLGAAVGMSAVGQGGVAQNMAQVSKMPNRKFASTKSGQQPRKQRAPQEVFDNSGYAGSSIDDNQNFVKHSFYKQGEDGSDGLYDDYGITDASYNKDDNSITYEYDYDTDSNQFNAGTHSGGEQAVLMQDMYKSFNSESPSPEQQARKSSYERQGIKSVTKTESGRVQVTAKAGTGGVKEVGQSNGQYHFSKRNGDNGSVNLLDSVEFSSNQNEENHQ